MTRKKQRHYNKGKKSGSHKDSDSFKKLRRNTDRAVRREYCQYISEVTGSSLESDNTKPLLEVYQSKKNSKALVLPSK